VTFPCQLSLYLPSLAIPTKTTNVIEMILVKKLHVVQWTRNHSGRWQSRDRVGWIGFGIVYHDLAKQENNYSTIDDQQKPIADILRYTKHPSFSLEISLTGLRLVIQAMWDMFVAAVSEIQYSVGTRIKCSVPAF
jgi:hypothetical protein